MELKDIFDYVGVEAENVDDFKKAFDAKFLTRENAMSDPDIKSKITGAMAGGVTTHLRRAAKETFGFEVSKDEIEGKKIEEIFDMIATTAKAEYEGKINDLSEQVKTAPKVDEAVAEWKGKYEQVLGEKANFENLLGETKTAFEEFKTNVETEKKSGAINSKVESLIGGLDWSDQTNDFTKTGFLTEMGKNYSLDLNEKGDLQIKKDGNLIPNPAKHGDFLSPSDVYKQEAEKNKLLKAPNAKSGIFVNSQPALNSDGVPNPNKRTNRATQDQAF